MAVIKQYLDTLTSRDGYVERYSSNIYILYVQKVKSTQQNLTFNTRVEKPQNLV